MASTGASVSCVTIVRMKKDQVYSIDKLVRDISFARRFIIDKASKLGEVNCELKGTWCFLLENFKLIDRAIQLLGVIGKSSDGSDGIDTSFTSFNDFVPSIPQSGRNNNMLYADPLPVPAVHDIMANLANAVAKVASECRMFMSNPGEVSPRRTPVKEMYCFAHPVSTSFAENAEGAFTFGVEVYIGSVDIILSYDLGRRKFNFEMDATFPILPPDLKNSTVKQKIRWEPLMWDRNKAFTCMVYNCHGETPEDLIERVKELCGCREVSLLIVTNTRQIELTHGDPWPILDKMPFPKFSYYGPHDYVTGGYWTMWQPSGVQLEFKDYSAWKLHVKVAEQLVAGVR